MGPGLSPVLGPIAPCDVRQETPPVRSVSFLLSSHDDQSEEKSKSLQARATGEPLSTKRENGQLVLPDEDRVDFMPSRITRDDDCDEKKGSSIDLRRESDVSDGSVSTDIEGVANESSSQLLGIDDIEKVADEITVNDTLKVIFVGMALSGKTSIIKRLIEGKDAKIPQKDERTIGVDIYEWDPKTTSGHMGVSLNTQISVDGELRSRMKGDVDVKFSVWDFAGQHVYHVRLFDLVFM